MNNGYTSKSGNSTKEKARRSFNYQCNRASDCRHSRYQVSCSSCPDEKTCDIQAKIEAARRKMY